MLHPGSLEASQAMEYPPLPLPTCMAFTFGTAPYVQSNFSLSSFPSVTPPLTLPYGKWSLFLLNHCALLVWYLVPTYRCSNGWGCYPLVLCLHPENCSDWLVLMTQCWCLDACSVSLFIPLRCIQVPPPSSLLRAALASFWQVGSHLWEFLVYGPNLTRGSACTDLVTILVPHWYEPLCICPH